MHKLAKLSAQERQRIIDDFVDDVFAGTDPDAPAASIARGMRQLPAELPDDPAPEQVNAWVELAELVARDDFRQRARSMVLAGQSAAQAQAQAASQADQDAGQVDYQAVAEHAREAAAQGIAPARRAARAVLDRIVAPGTPAAERARLLEQLDTFTDSRVERYWQLLAIINGQPVPPSMVPGMEWLIAALRADLS